MKKKFMLFIFIFSLFILAVKVQATPISSCASMYLYPGSYQLTNNLYATNATPICINLGSNVTLDCNNYSIIGQGANSNSGVNIAGATNVIVKNCNITNFQRGIEVYASNYSVITNNIITNNVYDGIQTYYSDYINITNNYFSNNNESGVDVQNGEHNSVFNNTITNSGMSGIDVFQNANYNTITYNSLIGQGCGVNIHSGANYNIVMNNTYSGTNLCDASSTTIVCSSGSSRLCGSNIGVCQSGTQTCDLNGRWGSCLNSIGPSLETCDGLDNDCNGVVDDVVDLTYSKTVTLQDVSTVTNPTTAGDELEAGTNAYAYYVNPGILVITDGPVLGLLGLSVPGVALDFANGSCLTVQDSDFSGFPGLPPGAAPISIGDVLCVRERNNTFKKWQMNIINITVNTTGTKPTGTPTVNPSFVTYDVYSFSPISCGPLCTDEDGDGFNAEGGSCGPVDFCPNTPVNFSVITNGTFTGCTAQQLKLEALKEVQGISQDLLAKGVEFEKINKITRDITEAAFSIYNQNYLYVHKPKGLDLEIDLSFENNVTEWEVKVNKTELDGFTNGNSTTQIAQDIYNALLTAGTPQPMFNILNAIELGKIKVKDGEEFFEKQKHAVEELTKILEGNLPLGVNLTNEIDLITDKLVIDSKFIANTLLQDVLNTVDCNNLTSKQQLRCIKHLNKATESLSKAELEQNKEKKIELFKKAWHSLATISEDKSDKETKENKEGGVTGDAIKATAAVSYLTIVSVVAILAMMFVSITAMLINNKKR